MNTSDRGIAALALHEGIVPGPYRDAVGVWTFGIGHTAAAGVPSPQLMPRGMPANLDAGLRHVFDVFRADLARYEAEVARALRVQVQQHEFDALVSFHFNTGAVGRADLTRQLNAGNRRAAAAAFMNWRKPASIIPRREAEMKLFRDGLYPSGSVPVWGVTAAGSVVWSPARRLTPAQVLAYLRPDGTTRPPDRPAPPPAGPNPFAGLLAFLASLFRRY